MIKKNRKMKLYNLFAVPLADGSFTLSQLVFLFENKDENYFSPTFAFFQYRYYSIEELIGNLSSIKLEKPVMIFTIADNPFKSWKIIGNREVHYENLNIANSLSSWGWFNGVERDSCWILEMFFGIYPWDSFHDEFYMDKLLLNGYEKPTFARTKKEFSEEELHQIGL